MRNRRGKKSRRGQKRARRARARSQCSRQWLERDESPLRADEVLREVTPNEVWIQEPREGCLAEEWDALTNGGFTRSHGNTNRGYVGYEFDSTKGYPGEGPPAKQKEQPESVVRCMALNTNGMGALERREAATTPEAGETMLIVASAKVSEVLQMLRAGKIQIAVLADTSLDEAGTANAVHLFREAG